MSAVEALAEVLDGMTTGPMPGSLLPCGCHIRRPDYEAVLCDEHEAIVALPLGVFPETNGEQK